MVKLTVSTMMKTTMCIVYVHLYMYIYTIYMQTLTIKKEEKSNYNNLISGFGLDVHEWCVRTECVLNVYRYCDLFGI